MYLTIQETVLMAIILILLLYIYALKVDYQILKKRLLENRISKNKPELIIDHSENSFIEYQKKKQQELNRNKTPFSKDEISYLVSLIEKNDKDELSNNIVNKLLLLKT